LYGLKQEPRAWYFRIYGYLLSISFTKSDADPNLYYIFVETDLLFFVLYVDELFLIGEEKLITWCKANLATVFEKKGNGMMHYFLGLEVWQRSRDIFLG